VTKTRPVIGVTPCSRLDDYLESVRRAGGEPFVLSNDDRPSAVLDVVDGVLLTGGLDVEPERYGEAPHPATEPAPDRDRFELPLAHEAVQRDVPLFAICRGVQVLNVAEGGTLIQDIPSEKPSELRHAVNEPKNQIAHTVALSPGTRLASSLAPSLAQVPGVKPRPTIVACPVNSRHHQAVGAVAPAFVVSAVSPDGIVEAIERPGARFCVGVQWHPENFWRTGEFDGLFNDFVAAAAQQRG
jgi:putative glutamine amidotransferase